MLLAARHQKAVLQKFGLQDMWTNYTKWTAEAVLPDHRGTTSLTLWKTSGGFPTIPRHGWVCGFSTPCGTAKT